MDVKLGIILLAAGKSSRLGQSKQLVRLDGTSLVRRAAELLLALDPDPCLVITGAESVAVSAELRGLPLKCESNPAWEDGMGASIACGARALPANLDGVMLYLCDQWRINRPDIFELYEAWRKDTSCIVASSWADITGPPVIFPARFIPRLATLSGDQGARVLMDEQPQHTRRVVIENARYDLDTVKDLDLLGRL